MQVSSGSRASLACGIAAAWLATQAIGQVAPAAPVGIFGQATFPGSQRPPGDPAVIARGAALFGINCKSCHGSDLRGGDLGGPNLLRSQIVLGDKAGEAIIPIVQQGRPASQNGPPMPALPLPLADIRAIAEYIHSVVSKKQNQGGPPPVSEQPLNILVGDPGRGQQYFVAHCKNCHSPTGDLAGLATRVANPATLQDSWVAGHRTGAPVAGTAPAPPVTQAPRTQVRVTLGSGATVQGTLRHIDDFTVSLITAQGQYLSFTRQGAQGVRAVEVQDPLQAHRQLLSQYTDQDLHDVTAYLATLVHAADPAPAVLPPPPAGALPPLLPPAQLLQPLKDSWPTYSGDYTGRRYSALQQVDRSNVSHLSLAWTTRLNGDITTTVGGEGTGDYAIPGPAVKGAVLQVGGVLYVTSPDNAWALDARNGTELWHYFWKTRGGTHIASRGPALWNSSLFFETPDDYLVSLEARTGHENWHVKIAEFADEYFSTMAPIVVGNHLLVGTGNDSDEPGFLQSIDPATGMLQWKLYSVPMTANDPALKTWPSLDAARHGGGQVWMPGSYDPQTDLYITGTGNPTPAYTGISRTGDNLYSCSLQAIRVATGERVWYYQTSPHDTHDWDSAQTPILIDGFVDGKPRKLVSTAARNGYFFTLDRVTGEHITTYKFGTTANWSKGIKPNGQPDPDPQKSATVPGSLVSPFEGGVTNYQAAAFNPDTGLFYTHENTGFNILYLTDPDPRGSMGLGGKRFSIVGYSGNAFQAIDYRTGKSVWRHVWPGNGGTGTGVLTTATGLIFTGDTNGNFVAMDAANGDLLWHSGIGNISSPPETFSLDGHQYVLVGVGDALYSFVLN